MKCNDCTIVFDIYMVHSDDYPYITADSKRMNTMGTYTEAKWYRGQLEEIAPANAGCVYVIRPRIV